MMNIAVGIITVPERSELLGETIKSLSAAGWDNPLVQFDSRHNGPWPTWREMLRVMLRCYSSSAHLLVCEDDIEMTAGLRDWLQSRYIPDGISSLYTAASNHVPCCVGWRQVIVPQRAHGALAYMFPRDLAERILCDPPLPTSLAWTDRAVGLFCRRWNIPYWCHTPSFVRHTGDESTLPPAGTPENRQCKEFVAEIGDLNKYA